MSSLQALSFDPAPMVPAGIDELLLSGYVEGIEVSAKGLDFGDQLVKAFMAEGLFGSRPIDHVWPLIPVKIPLLIKPTDSLTFDQVRASLQAKVGQINDVGAILKRVLPSGSVGYADIVEAKLTLSASWLAERRDFDANALLELQRLPDWYRDEVTGTAHEFTGDGAFTEDVGGDMPARVTKMLVEDKSGNAQQGLMFHYRGRNYSSAATAEWAYNAEALGPLDIAEKVTLTGSYGTKVVKHPKLSTGWTPVLSTNKAGTTFLTQTGLCNVWVRVYSTSEDLPWLRLVYGVGDIVAPSELTQLQVPGKEGFYDIPLGLVNIPALPFGAQRWEGVIQARGEKGGENIYIDRVRFQCADECSGVLLARQSTTALASVVASDSLAGENVVLVGTETSRGGKWEDANAKAGGFERELEGTVRTTTEDPEGRTALLAGSTVGAVHVKVEIARSAEAKNLHQGIYLRYFSSTFWVRISLETVSSFFFFVERLQPQLVLEYQAGGEVTTVRLHEYPISSSLLHADMDVEIDTAGAITARVGGETFRSTVPATFKKGEAHAEGKIGIYDFNPSATAVTRTLSHLVASPPPPSDAVMYANKAAYLSTLGNYRESEDGLGASPIGYPGTDLPRLPVGSPVEIAVHPSRGQFGELADSGKDKFKVQMSFRECFAEIPSS